MRLMVTDSGGNHEVMDFHHTPTKQEVHTWTNSCALKWGARDDEEFIVYEVKRVTSFRMKNLIQSEEVT